MAKNKILRHKTVRPKLLSLNNVIPIIQMNLLFVCV